MIKIKLKDIALKLNKNISEIARETGINRNTITSFYHNTVDGVKFETVEKICDYYNLTLTDFLEYTPIKKQEDKSIYRHVADGVFFTLWSPLIANEQLDEFYFRNEIGRNVVLFQGDKVELYYDKKKMDLLGEEICNKYNNKQAVFDLYSAHESRSKEIEYLYDNFDAERIVNFSEGELRNFIRDFTDRYNRFWSIAGFFKGYDAGYDRKKIVEIAERYKLSSGEIGILTKNEKIIFNDERLIILMEIALNILKGQKGKISEARIKELVSKSSAVKEYIRKFRYYKANYVQESNITMAEVEKEIIKLIKDPQVLRREYERLLNYEELNKREIDKVLRRHKLKENPLWFFAFLTYWREQRKRVNLMGVNMLFSALKSLEKLSHIPIDYLKQANLEEVDSILKGSVDIDVLKKRHELGFVAVIDGSNYKIITGNEAHKEIEGWREKFEAEGGDDVFFGSIASQGYASGLALVVNSARDLKAVAPDSIIILKNDKINIDAIIASIAAVVIPSGTVDCEAAELAREYDKPCIVGIPDLSDQIKNGDLVDVRGNHGTVRILKRKK